MRTHAVARRFSGYGRAPRRPPAKLQAVTNPERTFSRSRPSLARRYRRNPMGERTRTCSPTRIVKASNVDAVRSRQQTYSPSAGLRFHPSENERTAEEAHLVQKVDQGRSSTVPAYFNDPSSRPPRTAGQDTPVAKCWRIINEPTAAALRVRPRHVEDRHHRVVRALPAAPSRFVLEIGELAWFEGEVPHTAHVPGRLKTSTAARSLIWPMSFQKEAGTHLRNDWSTACSAGKRPPKRPRSHWSSTTSADPQSNSCGQMVV